jgi:hypothetical protein
MMTASAWLERLRDVTVAPPATEVVAELLAAYSPIAAARKALFDDPSRPTTLTSTHAALVAELKAREDAWTTALGAARDRVVAARLAIGKARRYQHAANPADFDRR